MAQRNLPTASVRDPRGSTDESERARVRPGGARERSYQERIDTLEREVDALEAELQRRDDRLQSVIDRYETILADQRREYERRQAGGAPRRATETTSLGDRLLDRLGRE